MCKSCYDGCIYCRKEWISITEKKQVWVKVEDQTYELIKNYRNGFSEKDFLEKCTDYFQDFDYIFGDYSYDKLRLKGFFDRNHKQVKLYNTIENLDSYIQDFCSYECRYFLLKKLKK